MRQYPFQVQPLSYGYISFAPYCDPDTLYLHHEQYYKGAVRELNRLVTHHRLEDWTLEELLTRKLNLPTVQAAVLRDTAGIVYNHELYFDSLQKQMGPPPLNRLVGALVTAYGSLPRFRRLVLEAADSLLGAGWVWLVFEKSGGPHIVVTRDNDVADLADVRPIFAIDLWEHAYFLDYQFDKEKYLNAWLSFLDWEKAEARFLGSV